MLKHRQFLKHLYFKPRASSLHSVFVQKSAEKPLKQKIQHSSNVSTNHSKGQFKTVFWLVEISVPLADYEQKYDIAQAKSLQQ